MFWRLLFLHDNNIFRSQFKLRLFVLHIFFAFFSKSIFDKFFCVRKIFRIQVLRDLQTFHFVFKITISKMRNLYSRLLFH